MGRQDAPKPFTTCKWTRVAPPPPSNPSRLANGQPHNPSRLANGQGLTPPPPLQPFTTCKWTRVAPPPPPTLHDLQMDKGWGPPQPFHDLKRDKGCPPPPPQPFTTCKWTRVGGPPTLHDLQMDNGWTRVGAPRSSPHYQHYGWTRVGPPQPFAIWGGSPNKLYRFNIRFQADQAPCPKIDKSMTGPFGPERTPTQTLIFVWTSIGASKPSNA